MPNRSKHSGFSLVEVLIAMVILAVGVLGTAGLMMASLRSNQSAGQTSMAARLAAEFQEILFMNTDGATDTGSSGGANLFTSIDTRTGYTSTSPASCIAAANTCAPAGMYAYLVDKWILRVARDLPGGVVVVCRDATPRDANGLYQWACNSGAGNNTLVMKIGWAAKTDNGENTFQQSGAAANTILPRFVVTLYGTEQETVHQCATGVATCNFQ